MTTIVAVAALALAGLLGYAFVGARGRCRQLERKLAVADQAAHTDPLTGLANRAGLGRGLIAQRAAAGAGDHLGIVMLDLDNLKQVNDRYGHDVGDAVIIQVAARIARPRAHVVCTARLGGDEFVILLAPQANPTKASQYAEQFAHALCASISQPMIADSQPLSVSASAGVAAMPAEHMDRLMAAADKAMYRAKSTGVALCRYLPRVDGPAQPLHRPAHRLRDQLSDEDAAANRDRFTTVESAEGWSDTSAGFLS
jgi:diguanylate cyclase (GGDEF)-like protein